MITLDSALAYPDKMYRSTFFAKLHRTPLHWLLFVATGAAAVGLAVETNRISSHFVGPSELLALQQQVRLLNAGIFLVLVAHLTLLHLLTINYRLPWNISDALPSALRQVIVGGQFFLLLRASIWLIAYLTTTAHS
jgi:hypothetical protein